MGKRPYSGYGEAGAGFRRRGAIDPNSPFLKLGKWIDENVVAPFTPAGKVSEETERRLKGEREKAWKQMLK